jgi:two-component system, cell cycle response regulator
MHPTNDNCFDANSVRDSRVRILLVEHNDADAQLLQTLLEGGADRELEMVRARSVLDALERLQRQHFDAMLLDLSLPGSEGPDVVRRITDHTNIPIIALSKGDDPGAGIEALLAGAEDTFIKQHINSNNIVRAIHYAIARHHRIAELHALSVIDELTGLYNRRGFMTLGEQQLKIARREKSDVILAFADLDRLKAINDQYGHWCGDLALKDIATVLKNTFRDSDLIARIGGDEFVILWIARTPVSSKILHARLAANLEGQMTAGDRLYRLSLSIGFSNYSSGFTNSLTEMLLESDRLMYMEKATRPCVTA